MPSEFTEWKEVRDFIIGLVLIPYMPLPDDWDTPRVVCTLCNTRQIDILGASATSLPLEGVPASKGVVIPCGHMFCANCWDLYNLQQATADNPYFCPTCINAPGYHWCGCPISAVSIPSSDQDPLERVSVNKRQDQIVNTLRSVPLTYPEGNSSIGGNYAMCKPCHDSAMADLIPAVMNAAANPPNEAIANLMAGVNDMAVFRTNLLDFAKTFSVVGWASWGCKECKANRSSCRFFVKIPPMNGTLLVLTHQFESQHKVEMRAVADGDMQRELEDPTFRFQEGYLDGP